MGYEFFESEVNHSEPFFLVVKSQCLRGKPSMLIVNHSIYCNHNQHLVVQSQESPPYLNHPSSWHFLVKSAFFLVNFPPFLPTHHGEFLVKLIPWPGGLQTRHLDARHGHQPGPWRHCAPGPIHSWHGMAGKRPWLGMVCTIYHLVMTNIAMERSTIFNR